MSLRIWYLSCLTLAVWLCSCSSSNAPSQEGGAVNLVYYDTYVSGSTTNLYSLAIGSTPTLIGPKLMLLAPPRGSKILALRDDFDSVVVVMTDEHGSAVTPLFIDHYPLPLFGSAPNGKLIAYTKRNNCYIRWLASGAVDSLPPHPFGALSSYWPQTPVFSPDSKHLALATVIGSTFHLCVADTDGTNLHYAGDTALLLDYGAAYTDPRTYDWSPDGSTVYYYAQAGPSGATALRSYDLASGTSTTLLTDTAIGAMTINVSPSGRYLFYQKIKRAANGNPIGTLVLYDIANKTSKEIFVPYQHYSGGVVQCEWTGGDNRALIRTSEADATVTQYYHQYLLLDVASGTTSAVSGFPDGGIGHMWWGRPQAN